MKPDSVSEETRKLKNWHPLFKLESVPDIPEAELPTLQTKIVDTAEYIRTGTLKSRVSNTITFRTKLQIEDFFSHPFAAL